MNVARSVKTISDVAVGDHVCWAYDDDRQLARVLGSYVRDGLAAGQRVACYLDGDGAAVRVALAGVERLDAALDNGSLIVGTVSAAYLPDGSFDAGARLREYAAMTAAAIDDGYAGFRVFGQAATMLAAAADAWPAYELRADLLVARRPMVALCAYDVRRCDRASLEMLRSVHARSFGAWKGESVFRMHGGRSGGLWIEGEVDFATAPAVEALSAEASRDLIEPVLDVSGVRFIDGAGMRAVVRGLRTIAAAHPVVRVNGATPMFKRLWTLMECQSAIKAEVVMA